MIYTSIVLTVTMGGGTGSCSLDVIYELLQGTPFHLQLQTTQLQKLLLLSGLAQQEAPAPRFLF